MHKYMTKLSIERLSDYLKAKKEYEDLKAYYAAELKAAEEEHLYSIKAVRYDGVKVDGGQHTDIADKIIRYKEWKKETDKKCEYWLNHYKRTADYWRQVVEDFIKDGVTRSHRLLKGFQEHWNSCNVTLLQEVLRLKYLEDKPEKDIAATLKITAQDVANMLYTYTEFTEKPPKRGRRKR